MTAQTMPIVAPLGPSWWLLLLQCCTGSLDAAAAPPPSANTPLTAEPANVEHAAGERKRWSREAATGPQPGPWRRRSGAKAERGETAAAPGRQRWGEGAGHGRAIKRWPCLLCPTCILQEAPEAPGWVHRSGPSRSLVAEATGHALCGLQLVTASCAVSGGPEAWARRRRRANCLLTRFCLHGGAEAVGEGCNRVGKAN